VDVREVDALIAAGRDEARELAEGELLHGAEGDWVDEPRARHRELLTDLLGRLVVRAAQDGDLRRAAELARRRAALDPLSEDLHRDLFPRLAAAGDRGAALSPYADLRRRLLTTLGVGPSDATRAVVDDLSVEHPSSDGALPHRVRRVSDRRSSAAPARSSCFARSGRVPTRASGRSLRCSSVSPGSGRRASQRGWRRRSPRGAARCCTAAPQRGSRHRSSRFWRRCRAVRRSRWTTSRWRTTSRPRRYERSSPSSSRASPGTPRRARSCSCSTTCTGRIARPCSCSATSCALRWAIGCSSWRSSGSARPAGRRSPKGSLRCAGSAMSSGWS
jgi:Bacterial transcriptional activator domain